MYYIRLHNIDVSCRFLNFIFKNEQHHVFITYYCFATRGEWPLYLCGVQILKKNNKKDKCTNTVPVYGN